jgi:signal transduction histidine kinase
MSLQETPVSRHVRNASGGSRRARKVNSEQLALQEKVHRQIASELHDSTCQHLVAASLSLMQVRNALSDPLKATRHCDQLDISIDRAMKELRSLTYLLHPQDLFEGGLKTTIEQFAEGFAARTSLDVEVSISPAVDGLPYRTQRSLLRIVQEALTNVYRHAKATKVVITIEVRDRTFKLEVRDDGQGMAAADGACRLRPWVLGTGLRIMRARMQEMGGQLEILSAPATLRNGTILRATFPSALARA